MNDLVERLRQWENARGSTSDILLDEVAEAAGEIEKLRAILGRCEAVSTGPLRSRCDLVKGHRESHESSDHGFAVWTNQG